jgi:uncharacterized membrane protein
MTVALFVSIIGIAIMWLAILSLFTDTKRDEVKRIYHTGYTIWIFGVFLQLLQICGIYL